MRCYICILAAMAMALAGCTGGTSPSGAEANSRVLATVGGVAITEEDLNVRLQSAHGGEAKSAGREHVLDELIREELLYQQGVKIGLDKDPGYRARIGRLERQLAGIKRAEMTRRVYNTQVASRVSITPRDAEEYFNAHREEIVTELHLGTIAFNTREEAETSLNMIQSGTSFEEIARSVTGRTPVSGREPWDLGFLPWERIPFDFADVVYRMKPGEVSGIVHARRTGFRIFKLLGTRKKQETEFPAVSGLIMNRLRDARVMQAYDQYVEQLMQQAKIVKLEERRDSLENK